MSIAIGYVNGSMDGKVKRVRSAANQPSQKTFIWKEFVNGKFTGRVRTEIYVLNRERRTYYLSASDGGTKGNETP